MNLSLGIIIFIILLLIFVLILLKEMSNFNVTKQRVDFPGTQSENIKRDCDVETTYSMEDAQCESICKQPGVFRTHNGVCINILTFDQEAIDNRCDPKQGVLAYLLGDPQFGRTKLICLSIDPGIQPDNIDKPNTICENGNIEINYIQAFPQLNNCKCPTNTTLIQIPSTSIIRTRGVCVNDQLKPVFNYNKLLYNPNSV